MFDRLSTGNLLRASTIAATVLAVAAILLAPFPFGAVAAPAAAFLITALCCALAIGMPGTPAHLRLWMIAPLALVAGAGALAYVQETVRPLIGQQAALWNEATGILGYPPSSRLALSAGRSLPALGGTLVAAAALACGIVAGRSRRLAAMAVAAVAVGGSLYAAASLAWYAAMPDYVLWWPKTAHRDDLTATFTNRNTAAIFLGMVLIANAARLASAIARTEGRHARRSGRVMTRARRRLLLNAGLAMPCLAAILLTNSRAGTILSVAMASMAMVLRLAKRKGRRSPLQIAVLVAFMGTPLATIVFFQTRLSEGLSDGGRIAAYQATLRMIADHPWAGVGLGSFASAFPAWRLPDAPMWGVWDRAHNTLLEIAAEVGLPAAGLVALFWLVVLLWLLRSVLMRPDASTVTAFAATLLGIGHSMVDFSIQIPGCGALFYFLAGMGIGRAADRRHRGRKGFPQTAPDVSRNAVPRPA